MKFHQDNRAIRIIDIFDLKDKQINISIVNSTDHVSGLHMHKYRTEYFFCVKGSFQVFLGTDKLPDPFKKFVYISDKNPTKYIHIQPFIYHGYKALEPNSIIMYYMDDKYKQSDEFKVKPGYFGESWKVENK